MNDRHESALNGGISKLADWWREEAIYCQSSASCQRNVNLLDGWMVG